MPSINRKQQRFFFAVKNCEEGGKCSPKTKKVADEMTGDEIEHFTHLAKNKKLKENNMNKETLKQAGYTFVKKTGKEYILKDEDGKLEAFVNNPNHASWGIKDIIGGKEVDLEFVHSVKESLKESNISNCLYILEGGIPNSNRIRDALDKVITGDADLTDRERLTLLKYKLIGDNGKPTQLARDEFSELFD